MKSRFFVLIILWIGSLTVRAQEPTLTPITADNAAEVIESNVLGFGQLRDIAWSPNGKTIAVASSTGLILYDADKLDRAVQRRLTLLSNSVSLVAFSPDNRLLASLQNDEYSGETALYLWDYGVGRLITEWDVQTDASAILFSPDGQVIGLQSGNQVNLWNIASLPDEVALNPDTWLNLQKRWYALDESKALPVTENAVLAYSPDGTRVATRNANDTVDLWDAFTGKRQITTIPSNVRLHFSPNGKLIFWTAPGGGNLTEVHIWDITLNEEAFAGAHNLLSFTFHPSESKMLFATANGNLWIWDARSRVQRIILGYDQQTASQTVFSVAFSPTTPVLAVGRVNRIELWDTARGVKLAVVAVNPSDRVTINRLVYSPDGALLATATTDGMVQIWNARTLALLTTIQHDGEAYDLDFSPDNHLLATYSPVIDNDTDLGSTAVFIWRLSTIVPNSEIIAAKDAAARIYHTNYVSNLYRVRFSPDGRTLVLTGRGIEQWNVAGVMDRGLNADSVEELRKSWIHTYGEDYGAGPLAWSPDGTHLATGVTIPITDQDCSFVIWNVGTDATPTCAPGDPSGITDLAYNPEGDVIASVNGLYGDTVVQLWDTVNAQQINYLYHLESVWSVAFSPDGGLLASGGGCASCSADGFSIDGTARLWSISPFPI